MKPAHHTFATFVAGAALAAALAVTAQPPPPANSSSTSPPPSGTVDRSSPGTYVKDSAITAKIKTKLAADHAGSLAKIHVDTDANGMVYLSGTAKSQADVDKAVSIAQSTEHVTSVRNDIIVRADD
jgi:hyperosmotically inducible periplasmic protein